MQRKDDELNQRDDINPGKRFVPLEPMPVRAIHPAHPMPGNPNIRFDDGVPVERHAYTAIGQVESIESDDQLFGLG
ncbi:MAG: hypothetical protein O2955_12430 [Planctomycetota bacterium]|nr:hypothetical protein [Planctomycetota bacterium]MDA1213317.1 hypothetical protein [Planctomycetota bacterium]